MGSLKSISIVCSYNRQIPTKKNFQKYLIAKQTSRFWKTRTPNSKEIGMEKVESPNSTYIIRGNVQKLQLRILESIFLTEYSAGFGDHNKSVFQRVCFSCLHVSHKMLRIPLWVRNNSHGRRTKGSEVVKCLF